MSTFAQKYPFYMTPETARACLEASRKRRKVALVTRRMLADFNLIAKRCVEGKA